MIRCAGSPVMLLGPLRCLLGLVRPEAQDVALVGAVGRHACGHVLLVEADAVLVQERLVMQVLGDHHVGHPGHECRVGPGPQRHPLVASVTALSL